MNIVKELEIVLKQPNFMGSNDKVGINLAVNAILDKIDELGFDIVEKGEVKEINAKTTNIKRTVDDLGRVAIPKPVRKQLGINEGDKLEIFIAEDGNVLLVKEGSEKPRTKYPEYILKMLRQHRDLDINDTSRDTEFNGFTPNEVFEEVLNWEGICGYASTMRRWVRDIYGVKLGE